MKPILFQFVENNWAAIFFIFYKGEKALAKARELKIPRVQELKSK